ncbi:MAG: GGDEF domain-containing protein [Betaproteobacteria bacterium]|nr:GGDEF domain-containing protein [Betaproteobacteria bacterium]
MVASELVDSGLTAEELKSFARTIAEIEWLLVILVMLYQIVQGEARSDAFGVYLGLIAFSVFVIVFHYVNLYRTESRWKLAIETWVMVAFVTWVVAYTGSLDSPLINLYLLPVVTSALALGQLFTLLQMGLVAACHLFLGYTTSKSLFSIAYAGDFATQLAPMLLVAYITTMLSADIRNALTKIKVISETDELTGIHNRRAFLAISRREFALSLNYARPFSIMMIDCDNLKTTNDTYGHESGNALLKSTVKCILGELRASDELARYGGDEFIALLPKTGGAGAMMVAERIRKRIEATPIEIFGRSVPVTVSIGVASFPDHGDRLEAILKNADQALYASKAHGRNRVTLFSAR